MAKNILVPTDGSKHANHALRTAIAMAEAFRDSIILLTVQSDYTMIHTGRFVTDKEIEEYEADLGQEALQSAIETLKQSGVPFTSKVRIGIEKDEICGEARDGDVRCIVMGSRGMTPVIGGVLGSVSYGVLHEAPCPVMIVPSDSNQ
ncbi:universal stress protein [Aneurinibacillus terranovensis]|uniref:universal stress protein n=1 Tax=Aneurinibacillus terranovensis TaxID=278991 RepID=UPI0003F55F49|nr:universal stress protein [Aneurinibacillus terranovensis]